MGSSLMKLASGLFENISIGQYTAMLVHVANEVMIFGEDTDICYKRIPGDRDFQDLHSDKVLSALYVVDALNEAMFGDNRTNLNILINDEPLYDIFFELTGESYLQGYTANILQRIRKNNRTGNDMSKARTAVSNIGRTVGELCIRDMTCGNYHISQMKEDAFGDENTELRLGRTMFFIKETNSFITADNLAVFIDSVLRDTDPTLENVAVLNPDEVEQGGN